MEDLSRKQIEAMAADYLKGSGGTSSRFPPFSGLESMAGLLKFAGWLALLGGIVLVLWSGYGWFTCKAGCETKMLAPLVGILVLIAGLGVVAFGDLLKVFVSIETNTYETREQVRREADYRIKLSAQQSGRSTM